MITKTPTGREVEIRKMKGKDEDIILDPGLERSGRKITVFLNSITSLPESEIDGMLQGERVFLLIEIIKLRDQIIYLPVKSPYGTKFEAEIDLSRLRYQPLNRKLVDDNYQYELTLPGCKKKITQRLLTGNDEKTIRQVAKNNPGKIMSYINMIRTVSIEDVKNININFFRELDSDDTKFLRDEYEKRDCGYDTEISLFDPVEMTDFDFNIPFDGNFFLGNTRAKKEKVRM